MFDSCWLGYIASLKQKQQDAPESLTPGERSQLEEYEREKEEQGRRGSDV